MRRIRIAKLQICSSRQLYVSIQVEYFPRIVGMPLLTMQMPLYRSTVKICEERLEHFNSGTQLNTDQNRYVFVLIISHSLMTLF